MSAVPVPDDDPLKRMEEATVWLQRLHSARPDEGVAEGWLEWCQRDPRNQQSFDEIVAIWEPAGQLPPVTPVFDRGQRRARRWVLAASAAGLGLATVLAVWHLSVSVVPDALQSEFSSPIGVNTVQTLADGSRIELGGGTRVGVSIDAGRRQVELYSGEVFVTVKHEPSRPFSVDAGPLQVVATGTAFNVRRSTGHTTVTVAEGSVDAIYEGEAAAAPNMRLQSSQQLIYSHASHRVVVRQADARNAIAWRTGTLHFENQPLAEVIATVNRYTTRKVTIEDPLVSALSFTGTARADRVEGWLQGLPHVFPVSIVDQPDGSRLIISLPETRSP